MAKIIDIEFLPKRKQDSGKRLVAHLDNNQSYTLKAYRGQAAHLAIGQEITAEKLPFLELRAN